MEEPIPFHLRDLDLRVVPIAEAACICFAADCGLRSAVTVVLTELLMNVFTYLLTQCRH